jgi:di/tricarboxylate transporter
MMVLAAVIVVVTLVVMASGRAPAVLALGLAISVAAITGVAPPADLFAGLSNAGVITVAGMLVIAKGVTKTGVVARFTWRLLATATTAGQALRRLFVPIGVASALINTTPIVAMMVSASRELEQTRGIPARQVLLPIAHTTTLAGSVTLIGSSANLLIAGIALTNGVEVSMLSFAPIALPVCVVGCLVLLVTSPRMLRGEAGTSDAVLDWRVEIPVSSRAIGIGRSPAELGLDTAQEYRLEAIHRWQHVLDPSTPLDAGDTLVFTASEAGVTALWGSPRFGLSPRRLYLATVGTEGEGTLRDLEQDGDLRVIAAHTARPLRETPALPGETYFVTCADTDVLRDHPALTLWQDAAGRAPQPRKTAIALAILVGVVVSASFGLVAVEVAAFTGALLMVLTGVLTPTAAVRALDWNVLFVLAGSIGLGAIVVSSGLAEWISDSTYALVGGQPSLVVAVFVVASALLTNLVTKAAAAAILTPVGIGVAADMGLDPIPLLAVIATCVAFTFIHPFSHQSNLMVMRPGGYTNASFARFGIPLVIVSMITAIVVGSLVLGA